ncbi:MAG: hypothetical protein BAA01_09820 [Bacillus thermozeamaize]|uniref:Uncharacterized protein n=1 Tax=Bacillus thermozeamaize TaxID=230954 RepID=A0A1Y3PRC2_9BACI|nr:MAG: hypothetical protein BAA01_09820 [Bacillus thermozeamaize]
MLTNQLRDGLTHWINRDAGNGGSTIHIHIQLGNQALAPEAIDLEMKLGAPVTVMELTLMLLDLYPSFSSRLPAVRSEAVLQEELEVYIGGELASLSTVINDDRDHLCVDILLKNKRGAVRE